MPRLKLISTFKPRFNSQAAEDKHAELAGVIGAASTHEELNTARATMAGFIIALEAFGELPASDCQLLRAETICAWSKRADQIDGINLRGLSGWSLFDSVIIVASSACEAYSIALEHRPAAKFDDIRALSGHVLLQSLLRDRAGNLAVDGPPICELIACTDKPAILGAI
ncbi:MAG: hypothetical protein K2X80_04925 [Pseudomonadaceae bacterium]|nr:hypothetical protein [Pseudomonadaceae bacterium]